MLYQICIKQVLDVASSPSDRMVLNAYDASAIEAALVLREQHGGEVSVVLVGPPSAESAIRRALAMGADSGTHLVCEDKDYDRLDSFAFATILRDHFVGAKFDVVFCGKQSQDTDAGLTGAMLAELLGLPYVTNAVAIDHRGAALLVTRQGDAGQEAVELPFPCLVTCSNDLNDPRIPSLRGTMAARNKRLESVLIESVPAVKLNVNRLEKPPRRQRGEIIRCPSIEETVSSLVDRLQLRNEGL